jgi:D-alanyl-D-alanine carboxypeptidase
MKKKQPKDQPRWLAPALDYIQDWLSFQVERYRQPGCAVAIAQGNELVAEYAFGHADLRTKQRMTPRHRFRIASHSKSFTASGVLLLREQGKLGLDDPIGRHVQGLHKDLAGARIAELLSHGAGVTRDGADSGQFQDLRPYLSREELMAELSRAQPLEPGMQLKYSNHGYGLLGLMIEQVTGCAYADWTARNIIAPAGLRETVPDTPHLPRRAHGERPQHGVSRRPTPDRAGRQPLQRHRPRGRLRLHGRGHRPLFRAARSQMQGQHPVAGQPPRDAPAALA